MVAAVEKLRKYLDENPQLREFIAEWVEDYILDQSSKCLGWIFGSSSFVTFLLNKIEMKLAAMP